VETTKNFIVIAGAISVVVILAILSFVLGWFGEAAQVAREEASPRAILKKYEWFKDTAAQLQRKQADIRVMDARLKPMRDVPRTEMDRHDKAELAQVEAERFGLVSSFNSLAAEYNAAMSKINYRFCNVGDLPEGADQPLPREFARYKTD